MNKYQFRSLYNLGWVLSAQIFWLHNPGKVWKIVGPILFFVGLISVFIDALRGNTHDR